MAEMESVSNHDPCVDLESVEVEPAVGRLDEALKERISDENAEERLNAEETTVLVVLVQGLVIAAACYSTGTGNITCIPDRVEDQEYSFATLLKQIFQVCSASH